MICSQCGKTIPYDEISFCPYCGKKLALPENVPVTVRDSAEEKWIQKAMATISYPDREKILQEGLRECPDSRRIEWELLFIGEKEPKDKRSIDFSIIQSWALEIYREPEKFSEAQKDKLRTRLFNDLRLIRYLSRAEDPERSRQEYLHRICAEYVELFLEGNNRVMGNIFGFRIERDREKKLAVPVAEMIGRIRIDEKLSPEQREQLWKSMYQAYGARAGGKTEQLDRMLTENR